MNAPPHASALAQTNAAAGVIPPHIARQAVQWLLNLRAAPSNAALRADWTQWLAADPLHAQAWQRIEAVNQRLRPAASPFAAALAQAGLQATSIPGRRRTIKSLAITIVGGGAAWMTWQHTPWRETLADVRTGVGEQRRIALPDGSEATLNTASALNIRFGPTQRRVQLLAGEVLINTQPDSAWPARPFWVDTAQGAAQALGTHFCVRQDDGQTQVAVFSGAVALHPRRSNAIDGAAALTLNAGQQARLTDTDATPATPADAQTATAWTQGALIALAMPLGEFVQELARYTDTRLACDPAIAHLRISGSYPTGNAPAAMRSAAQALSLQLRRTQHFWGSRIVLEPNT